MKIIHSLAVTIASLISGAAFVPSTTHAQSNAQMILPPDTMLLSPDGVDLTTGVFQVNKTLLAVGDPAKGGIDFRRVHRNYGSGLPMGKMGQFNHNWDIRFKESTRGNNRYVSVTSDALSFNFNQPWSPGFAQPTYNGPYATISRTDISGGYYYTLQTPGGMAVVSRPVEGDGSAYAASVTQANGVTYSLTYDALGPSGGPRLRSVVSNQGYALLLDYFPNSGTDFLVSKACVVNLTAIALPASCPAAAPTVSYTYSGKLMVSETDAAGKIWEFSSTDAGPPGDFVETFKYPGEANPYMTLHYTRMWDALRPVVNRQIFADGRTVYYQFSNLFTDPDSGIMAQGYSNAGATTSMAFGAYRPNAFVPVKFTPGPERVTDPLGRTTNLIYCHAQACGVYMLRTKISPDGIRDDYDYDGLRNIVGHKRTPKAGSGALPIESFATYETANIVNSNKPISFTDFNAHVTNYSYDAVHGGMLTETKPADANGVRPQTRYSYAQRRAWIRNSAGTGYVAASGQIWVLTEERTCKTTATVNGACAGGASDEIVTTYDYGPDSGPNNLLLRGKVVDAGSGRLNLRTCFGYDSYGNKISETEPKAGLATCP